MLAFFWVFLFFLIQNVIQIAFGSQGVWLVLVVVLYYALGEGPLFGMTLGGFAGFLMDILGVNPMGFWIAVFALSGLVSGFFSSNLFRESLITQILLPVFFVYLISLTERIFLSVRFHQWSLWDAWIPGAYFLKEAVMVAVASPIVFYFLKKSQPRHPW